MFWIRSAESENWSKLMRLIKEAGHELCKHILHNKENMPRDGAKLYQIFLQKQAEFNTLMNRNKLKKIQFDKIFPPNGKTDISRFDITLFTLVIEVMFGKNKYKREIKKLREWRNGITHYGQKAIDHEEFEKYWDDFLKFIDSCGIDGKRFSLLKGKAITR